VTRRLDAAWLRDRHVQAVCACLTSAGQRAYFVGGCVRNALLDLPVADIDLATDALPETVLARAASCGLRAIPTGLAHGTVTLVAGGQPFEITTFRRDVETFGRHATVAFSRDIAEDAARRDFTMNALYATPEGVLVDPIGGLPDLRAGRVRFVGQAERRIREDYLRILRFFRFHAWYGDAVAGPDRDGLAACAAMRDGLDGLSRERVGHEMRRLLAARDPAPALAAMDAAGILDHVLPGADSSALPALVRLEAAARAAPRWQRRLAALGWNDQWPDCLRLSRAERRALDLARAALAAGEAPAAAAYRNGIEAARDAALVAAARIQAAVPETLEEDLALGATVMLPVEAGDLPQTGPALGVALRQLEEAWIASGFTLDRDVLLARL
jgi:poly(A) polymerase